MELIYIFLAAVVVFGVIILFFKNKFDIKNQKPKYIYKRQNFFLTKAEHEFYDVLVQAVGHKYTIFAQVHLPTILEHKVVGQNWNAAFRHISQKSVDFVLCDKEFLSPKLAIELDDKTHERADRQERDIEVERILKVADLPLLRIQNHGIFNPKELSEKIQTILNVTF